MLYAGIRILNKPYENLPITNINTDDKVIKFKDEVSKLIDVSKDDVELVYQGLILNDDSLLNKIPNESIVHVIKKNQKYEPIVNNKEYTSEDHIKIAKLFENIASVQLTVSVRINVLQKLIDEFPIFRLNLGAQSFIRDSVLFQTLAKPEVIAKIATTYPVICDAAEFIVKTTRKELARSNNMPHWSGRDESYSDTTNSSEEENSSSMNNSEMANIRRISRAQLAAAISQAGNSSANTLSNIAERNLSLASSDDIISGLGQNPSPNTSRPISSNVLSDALRSARESQSNIVSPDAQTNELDSLQNMDTSETAIGDTTNSLPTIYQNHQYANELRLMRQIGLTNDTLNLNVLNITNGNVESAINLILCSPDIERDLR